MDRSRFLAMAALAVLFPFLLPTPSPAAGARPGAGLEAAPEGAAGDARPCALRGRLPALVAWRGPYSRGYEVLVGRDHAEALPVTVEHEGAACAFRLEVEPDGTGADLRAGGHRLAYEVALSPAGPALRAGAGTLLSGAFPEGAGRETRVLYVRVPAGQMVPGGTTYAGRLVFRLYEETADGDMLQQEHVASLEAAVPAVARAGIVDGTGERQVAVVAFGDLERGKRRSSTLRVLSNSDVGITFATENRGALRHLPSGAAVAYSLSVDGRSVDLSAGGGTVEVPLRDAAGERAIALDFTLDGDTRGLPAGSYADTLTAVVTPRH